MTEEEVDYDVESYATQLEKILDQKIDILTELRGLTEAAAHRTRTNRQGGSIKSFITDLLSCLVLYR